MSNAVTTDFYNMLAKKPREKKLESKKKGVGNERKRPKVKAPPKNAKKHPAVSPLFMDGVCSKVVVKEGSTLESANKLIHHTQSGDGSQRLFEKSRDQQKNIKAANSNIKSKEKHSGSNEPNLSRSIFAKIDRMFEDKLKENIKVQYSNEACESVGINTNLFNNMSDQWTGLSEKAKEKCAKQVQTLMGDIDEVLMGKSESQQSFPNCSGVVNQNVDLAAVHLLPSTTWVYNTPKKSKTRRQPPPVDQPCMLKPAFLQIDSNHKTLYELDDQGPPFYNSPCVIKTSICKLPPNQMITNKQSKPSYFDPPAQKQSIKTPYESIAQYHHPPPTHKQDTIHAGGGWAPFHSNLPEEKRLASSPELNLFSSPVFDPTYEEPSRGWTSFEPVTTHRQPINRFDMVPNNRHPDYPPQVNRLCCSKDYGSNENINHTAMWKARLFKDNEKGKGRFQYSPVDKEDEFVFQPNLF